MVTAIAARHALDPAINELLAGLARHSRDVLAHGVHVAVLSIRLGHVLGLDDAHLDLLARAALLHDVGKQDVPLRILDKAGALTDDEWEVIRDHPEAGHRRLVDAEMPEEAQIVLHHHERVDGCGYPCGCAGEDIPLESRVLAVADAFDAMTTLRPYRSAMTAEAAVAELRAAAGHQYDPLVVEALADVLAGAVA